MARCITVVVQSMLCAWRKKKKKTTDTTRKKQQTEESPLSVAVIRNRALAQTESACARDLERPNFDEQYFLHFLFFLLQILSKQSFVVGLFQLFEFNTELNCVFKLNWSPPSSLLSIQTLVIIWEIQAIFLHHMLSLKFCLREYKQKPWKWNRIKLFTF